jgi:predicted site-specific integrase-resolvase
MANKAKTASLNPDSNGRLAYRFAEASKMIGIPASTLRTMARRGEINPVTSFGTWLITAKELEALLQKRLRNTDR